MIIYFEIDYPLERNKIAYFRVLGREDTYEVRIKIENGEAVFEPADCTCKFGSFWGQTKENRKNGKVCRHITDCLDFLERGAWINSRKNKSISGK